MTLEAQLSISTLTVKSVGQLTITGLVKSLTRRNLVRLFLTFPQSSVTVNLIVVMELQFTSGKDPSQSFVIVCTSLQASTVDSSIALIHSCISVGLLSSPHSKNKVPGGFTQVGITISWIV